MAHEITPTKALHSVDMCALFVSLDKPILPKEVDSIADMVFPGLKNLRREKVSPNSKRGSLNFYDQTQKEDQPAWRLLFSQKKIGVICHEYIRWQSFYAVARDAIRTMRCAISNRKIKGVSLGVLDEFTVHSKGDFPLTELFLENSPLIAPEFLKSPLPPARSRCATSKRIQNIQPWAIHYHELALEAHCAHKQHGLAFYINDFQSVAGPEDTMFASDIQADAAVDAAASFLHEQNKSTLKSILSSDVLSRIGL